MTDFERESPIKNIKTEMEEIIKKYFDLTDEELNLLTTNLVQITEALVTVVSAERKDLEGDLDRWINEGGNIF